MTYLDMYRAGAEAFGREAAAHLADVLARADIIFDRTSCVVWRIKTDAAIQAKLSAARSLGEAGLPAIKDFVGIRVIATHLGLLDNAVAKVSEWSRCVHLIKTGVQDSYAIPRPGGYRAVHLNYQMPASNRWNLPTLVSTEVQVTTWLQCLHGGISHAFYYKANSPPDSAEVETIRTLSDKLYGVDLEVATILRALEHDREQKPANRAG